MSEEKPKCETGSQLIAALVKAQAELEGAKKDSENPHFRSKYADLASVVDAIKPVSAKFGLAYFQRFHDNEGGIAIETIILHESGEQLSNGILRVPATKQDAQGYGSAITYARRYSLQTAFGVAPEEDDGTAAAAAEKNKKADPKPPAKAEPKPEPAENTDKHVAAWCKEMEGASVGDLGTFRAWWKTFEADINTDCGKAGAAKVYAAFVATGTMLAKKAAEGAK